MDFKINDMCQWEREKAVFLTGVAEKLGMDIEGYGEVAVNPNSGYTYLWCEDYNFSLYLPIDCELKKSDVVALWTNSEDGNEEEFNLSEDTTLEDIEKWTEEKEEEMRG